jgi:hypothetical protein
MDQDFILTPADEYMHVPDAGVVNYNESVYTNCFDGKHGMGGWMRLGNRANEGVAELAVCLYLPDGRVACQFKKPKIDNNERLDAGGLRYEVLEPFKSVRMSYEGSLMVLDDPSVLRKPETMAEFARKTTGRVEWNQVAMSPTHGGVPTSDDVETYYGRDFSVAHFNQHMRVHGHIQVGDERWDIDGMGWRDHSWGPRYWQNIFFYRLFLANFEDGRGLMLLKITDPSGKTRRRGVLLVDGQYEEVIDMDVITTWTPVGEPAAAQIAIRTKERGVMVRAEVVTSAPLRNRRKIGDAMVGSRIVEAFGRYEWDGVKGLGMLEYIDLMDDERPIGVPL